MDLQNLLDNHPDGLGKHIEVYRFTDFSSKDELGKFISVRLCELGEICFIVRHFSLPSQLLFLYGTDLVNDAVSRGNEGMIDWLNSQSGQFYQDQAFEHLGLQKEECFLGIVTFNND